MAEEEYEGPYVVEPTLDTSITSKDGGIELKKEEK